MVSLLNSNISSVKKSFRRGVGGGGADARVVVGSRAGSE